MPQSSSVPRRNQVVGAPEPPESDGSLRIPSPAANAGPHGKPSELSSNTLDPSGISFM